ncbi:MAG: serine/threonine-protein kinase, partial [Solirubrobacteraceae bacterium]
MFQTGSTIAGYRIERLLGSGGMGTVYLAEQSSLKRPVALKLLSPQLTEDETFRARFRREGEVQAALDHPHIVPIYEAGESEDGLYLAMRYVRGSTLKDLITEGELDPARTLQLLAPVAAALDAAHASGLIHRDVKPQNILVDQTDWPYLADFGLTRGGGGGPTRTGQLVGTFAYIAPEQVQGRPASPRSDQYALAAVLFECLSGEVAHNHESDAALLYAKVHEEPPPLSARAGDVPAALDAVLARGLSRDPDDRYASATALVEAARDALGVTGVEVPLVARRRRTPLGA